MVSRRTLIEAAFQTLPVKLRYEVWDVFTSTRFGGNPLAVFFDSDGLSDEQRFALTREMNHSETTFVTREGKVRIFTATQELPFAGHPVLGTAFALHRRNPSARTITVQVPQGPIPVTFEGATAMMVQQDPEFKELHDARFLAPLLGLKSEDLVADLPIQNVSTGRPNLIVVVKTIEALKSAKFNWPTLQDYLSKGDIQRGIYLLSPATLDRRNQMHARKLTPRLEDPATGSAAGCAAAYAVKHRLIAANTVARMEQGHFMNRPSEILISAAISASGGIEKVQVGGSSVLVLSGTVEA